MGTATRFYLRAYDGGALYTKNCASWHQPLATSTRKGRTAAQITDAINTQAPMTNLKSLTPAQIRAIAYSLSK